MGKPRYKEQYARAYRYFEKLMQLKNMGSVYRDPELMTPDELTQYGLTSADRDRIKQWMKQIPREPTTLDEKQLAPVSDIFTKWIEASANLSPDYADTIYTFFQHCYHVKDWIKNDPIVGSSLGLKVEAFINASPALSLCADISNGSKHLLLNKSRSGHEPKLDQHEIAFSTDEPEKRVTLVGVRIEHGGTELDVFEVAEQCMKDWKTFLGE